MSGQRSEREDNNEPRTPEVDEYLWPLTGELWPIDWSSLAEEIHIRERLAEIAAHVRDTHLRPRLRRLGPAPSAALVAAMTQSIVDGPADGPLWAQVLKDPVPRALREEWARLTQRLRAIDSQRHAGSAPDCGRR
jgi:hypothetical protein